MSEKEHIHQEIETFKEWLKGSWQWDALEVMERHALIANMLHLSLGQLSDTLAYVPLLDGGEYRLFIYHLCLFLKSLELQKEERGGQNNG